MNGFYGAFLGDIVGSPFEEARMAKSNFPLFSKLSHITDDSVLTTATMDLLLKGAIQNDDHVSIAAEYRRWAKKFPNAGYGWYFISWLDHPGAGACGSEGNGAAMRVSPVAYLAKSKEECIRFAKSSASVTHNTAEGSKGAESIALLTYLALHGATKEEIRQSACTYYPKIERGYSSLIRNAVPTALAKDTVPEAIAAFLESCTFEDCIRKAVLVGGDTDTLASMAGSLAGAYYGIEDSLIEEVLKRMDDDEMLQTLAKFVKKCRLAK